MLAGFVAPSPSPTTDPATVLGSGAWWAEFWTSSAVGGLAALIAAVLALIGVLLRARHDRREAETARAAEEAVALQRRQDALEDAQRRRQDELDDSAATHWWAMYTWAIGHMVELRRDPDAGKDFLEALWVEATNSVQKSLVAVAIDMLLNGEVST
ncbi:hypothetical protein [Cellulomonas sp. SLBN-39]|uniref:hypothetical protein n=1 Tax=Cellulomonas sp. SLBN-39 TaxID=2768446 RepID=UPI0011521A6B|nr:hypothetical protein [Cellulomonas sp. SLBN-39]